MLCYEKNMIILSTTNSLQGYDVKEYFGIITGEAILGANILKDLFASVRDVIGGRSKAYEEELQKAREVAQQEIKQAAMALGANAVLGVDIDYETVGANGSMMMVSITGTAVFVDKVTNT